MICVTCGVDNRGGAVLVASVVLMVTAVVVFVLAPGGVERTAAAVQPMPEPLAK
jgi:hypothetical protein